MKLTLILMIIMYSLVIPTWITGFIISQRAEYDNKIIFTSLTIGVILGELICGTLFLILHLVGC